MSLKVPVTRAYGWTVNTPLAKDYGYDNSCGEMSEQTFMHTGYTGTCCCVDPAPESPMWTVILTNRYCLLCTHPTFPDTTLESTIVMVSSVPLAPVMLSKRSTESSTLKRKEFSIPLTPLEHPSPHLLMNSVFPLA